ncbi:MAG: hypothetical protein ACYC2U_04655 [Candidatus Amoebophilus sp.]
MLISKITKTKEYQYVSVLNDTIRDNRLSYKARGILAVVLSLRSSTKVNISYLIALSDKDGRDSIKSALEELMHYGYAKSIQEKDRNGKFTTKEWFFYELPITENP